MTSASSSSARILFADSKLRLADRVQANVNNITSLARHIQRGSKSYETLLRAAREYAQTETCMENIEMNLKKSNLIAIHLQYQHESMLKSAEMLSEVHEQAKSIQQKFVKKTEES